MRFIAAASAIAALTGFAGADMYGSQSANAPASLANLITSAVEDSSAAKDGFSCSDPVPLLTKADCEHMARIGMAAQGQNRQSPDGHSQWPQPPGPDELSTRDRKITPPGGGHSQWPKRDTNGHSQWPTPPPPDGLSTRDDKVPPPGNDNSQWPKRDSNGHNQWPKPPVPDGLSTRDSKITPPGGGHSQWPGPPPPPGGDELPTRDENNPPRDSDSQWPIPPGDDGDDDEITKRDGDSQWPLPPGDGHVWVGSQGPYTIKFTSKSSEPMTLIVWTSEHENDHESSSVSLRQPKISVSLPKRGRSVTISLAEGVKGGFSTLSRDTKLNEQGQISNTWAQFETSVNPTLAISHKAEGSAMSASAPGECDAKSDCSGWANGRHLDITLGSSVEKRTNGDPEGGTWVIGKPVGTDM